MPTRRTVLQLGALAAAGAVGTRFAGASSSAESGTPGLPRSAMPVPYAALFVRPPELTPYSTGFDDGDPQRPFAKYAVTARLGQARIVPGLTTTVAGYNGIFPGPTIRARQGTRAEVRIRNALPGTGLVYPQAIDISTHLHGAPALPQYDGYANDITRPGYVKNYHYPNTDRASTLWYHDHRHLVTAQNVYSGLAAFYPISDPFEQAQLPQGEFDVPLMISDAIFHADGSLAFEVTDDKGLWGNVVLVNGVPWPTMRVKPRIYRFRVLIASIGRSYRPTLSTGDPVYVVATDDGMVPVVAPVASWRQGTAERYEILIDFRKYRVGQKIDLRNLSNNNIDFADTDKIMRFEVVEDSGPGATITAVPTTLDRGPTPDAARGLLDVMALTPAMAVARRTLRFERDGGRWTVNGVTWEDVESTGFRLLFAEPSPLQCRAVDLRERVGRLVPPGARPPDRGAHRGPEHQRRQALRVGGRPEGRLLRRRGRVRDGAHAVRAAARGRGEVHDPLPQPHARGQRHDGAVRGGGCDCQRPGRHRPTGRGPHPRRLVPTGVRARIPARDLRCGRPSR